MTLEELLSFPIAGKQIVILGRPSSGKTWLAQQFDPKDFDTLHTDEYLCLSRPRAIHNLIEDSPIKYSSQFRIIEGMLAYDLLLQGAKDQSYTANIIITCEISAGKQREIYLKERDSNKIRYQQRFYNNCLHTFNEYLKVISETERPQIIEFQNNWNYATEVKDK